MTCYRGNNAIEESEIAIVEAEPARKLPDPFDWVQFRAVGRQEVQDEMGSLPITPLPMEFGPMILRIVTDGQHAAVSDRTGLLEDLEELPEGFSVESSGVATKQNLAG